MLEKAQSRPDLLLLLSLLLVIVMYPLLDYGGIRKLIMAALIFVPLIPATVWLSKIKGWLWPSLALMAGFLVFSVASIIVPHPTLIAIKWAVMAAFFGLTVVGLFSYLKNARSVTDAHLYTAVSCSGCCGSPSTPPLMSSIPVLSGTPLRGRTGKANCCTSAS
jgi:hypothetical protein